MEQSSRLNEMEGTEMMNIEEVARATEYMRALGLSYEQISKCMTYIATGVGLPIEDDEPKEK